MGENSSAVLRRERSVNAALADIGGLLVPAAGSAARAGAYEQLAVEDVNAIVAMAGRAPSVHNTQPWHFRLRHGALEVLADPSRQLRVLDPAGRELLISCGAAVFGARLGMRSRGRVPQVWLRPDLEQPRLAAQLVPAGLAPLSRLEAEMIVAVPHRHTHRGPFAPEPVGPRLLSALCTDAVAEGCQLVLVSDPDVVRDLGGLVTKAAAAQRALPNLQAELTRWLRHPADEARDGIPADARPETDRHVQRAALSSRSARHSWPDPRPDSRLPGRSFALPGTELSGGGYAAATAVLTTPADTPADWLRAGQALHRLLLRAAARWVFAALQSEPLEVPRCRRDVRSLLALDGYPQMLIQFGRANTTRPTPRRPVSELLIP